MKCPPLAKCPLAPFWQNRGKAWSGHYCRGRVITAGDGHYCRYWDQAGVIRAITGSRLVITLPLQGPDWSLLPLLGPNMRYSGHYWVQTCVIRPLLGPDWPYPRILVPDWPYPVYWDPA